MEQVINENKDSELTDKKVCERSRRKSFALSSIKNPEPTYKRHKVGDFNGIVVGREVTTGTLSESIF